MVKQLPLVEADGVEILTVIDNVADALLPSTEVARRLNVAGADEDKLPQAEAPLLEAGRVTESPVAEHGLSFLVSVTVGDSRRTVLFDTGSTVRGLVNNLSALGIDLQEIETIVLSHGHFDHAMGLNGLAKALFTAAAAGTSPRFLAETAGRRAGAAAARTAGHQPRQAARRGI